MSARAGVVSQPNAVVLDIVGILLEDFAGRDDLTVGLLDTFQVGQKVPETAASAGGIGSEDLHAEDLT